jgi:hypothetical protein
VGSHFRRLSLWPRGLPGITGEFSSGNCDPKETHSKEKEYSWLRNLFVASSNDCPLFRTARGRTGTAEGGMQPGPIDAMVETVFSSLGLDTEKRVNRNGPRR